MLTTLNGDYAECRQPEGRFTNCLTLCVSWDDALRLGGTNLN